jgi:uncharacterized FAD-dependent dehydrogenase
MRTLDLTLTPEEYFTPELLKAAVARSTGTSVADISHVEIVRRSLDSRRGVRYRCQAEIYLAGETFTPPDFRSNYRNCHTSHRVVIVGAGPAGLFAALHAIELGLKPIIVERGKAVDERRKDITLMVRNGSVNNDSNWCFGEGGAGTYSDGKLYTRSTKRGDVGDVMRKFVEHGADPKIMIDAHAHIGTDRLSGIISQMRATIVGHGGEIHFNQRVDNLVFDTLTHRVSGVHCTDGTTFEGNAVLLATGHSARDIYELFHRNGWKLEAKPFAIGVRVEHPQRLIDDIQYHGSNHSPLLPPAAYSLTTQVDGHGVFSFCMCPGGIIVPAATANGEQVVNGMSNASRSSAYANSGIAVTVTPDDVPDYARDGELALLRFQQDVERRTAAAAGGGLKAPCQRLTDFCEGKGAGHLNRTNYMGQCTGVELQKVLPAFVSRCLRQGFRDFGRKMHGFYTSNASLLAVESRTSSPVRIPRGDDGQHPQLRGLFPCGEGAGYAGGIVSSAMDGMKMMEKIKEIIGDQ